MRVCLQVRTPRIAIFARHDVARRRYVVSQRSWKKSTTLRTVALAWLSVLEIRTMYAQEERDRTAQRQSIDLQSLGMTVLVC